MITRIYEDYRRLSTNTAREMLRVVLEKPEAVLCLATGATPLGAYAEFVRQAKMQRIDFSGIRFVSLDEWVGIPPSNPGSCHYFLNRHLFQPLQIAPAQIYLFDGMSADLQGVCSRMDEHLEQLGGIDFLVVGIGLNGHIGFNEPGVAFDNKAHVVDLHPITKTTGQKYFQSETLLNQGITLGIRQLMDAKTVILMANGAKKTNIIQQALEGTVSNALPASILQSHPNCLAFLDAEAAAQLQDSSRRA
ncbi:MAG: glucosamine-6-phosphate deaminase [Saprospiraceae bacterium]|nr:glucosamine-6-phosphate deaminase [Saprospiraceae bacterium]